MVTNFKLVKEKEVDKENADSVNTIDMD